MHKTTLTSLMLSALLLGSIAWAQEDVDTGTTTRVEEKEVTRGALKKEGLGVKPEVGVIAYKDALNNTTSRAAAGLSLDMNLARFVAPNWTNVYIGPQTGAVYSHLGSASSNFFGASPDQTLGNQAGANLLIIPANLKVGYNLSDNMRVAAHGGGNVIYRSVGNAMNLGPSTATTGNIWRIYPNVGADFDVGFGQNVAMMIRPDVTFTPGNEIFTGTVGLGIAIG